MRHGDIIIVAVQGDYGKPRPAVVIESAWLGETNSVLVCLLTTTLRETPIYRLTVEPTPENGLQAVSQVMVDKIMAVQRDKCGAIIGKLDNAAMLTLNRMLALVVGIAD